MFDYKVSLGLDDAPYRIDVTVSADSESEAVAEAKSMVPNGMNVTKVIDVEKR